MSMNRLIRSSSPQTSNTLRFSIVLSSAKIKRRLSIFSVSFLVYSCSCHVLLSEAPRQI